MKVQAVDGVDVDIGFEQDPGTWRERDDPDEEATGLSEEELEDDPEDAPTPSHVVMMLGFDPDDIDWDEEA